CLSFWRALLRGTGLTGRVRKRSIDSTLPAPTENVLSTSEERPAEQARQTADVAVPSHVGASSFDTVDPFPDERPEPPAPPAGPRPDPRPPAGRLGQTAALARGTPRHRAPRHHHRTQPLGDQIRPDGTPPRGGAAVRAHARRGGRGLR